MKIMDKNLFCSVKIVEGKMIFQNQTDGGEVRKLIGKANLANFIYLYKTIHWQEAEAYD